MRTILRHALTVSGAASWIVFAVMFAAALARDRKRQRQRRDLEWLRQGGHHVA